ncbi:MAG: GDSL-type esterase/lipase family protein [Tissierellia bacterium]|nr:GDSL-type esterase/lipase family protein [Tissierellia bacterium]
MKILALGDSFLTGYLVGGSSFINELNDSYDIDNRGINGGTIGDLKSISNEIDQVYDLCVIHIGINDFLIGLTPDEVLKEILNLMETLKKYVKDFILISPIKITSKSIEQGWSGSLAFQSTIKKQKAFNEKLKSFSSSRVHILSFYDHFKDSYRNELLDGIHPSRRLHREMAAYLKKYIEEIVYDE